MRLLIFWIVDDIDTLMITIIITHTRTRRHAYTRQLRIDHPTGRRNRLRKNKWTERSRTVLQLNRVSCHEYYACIWRWVASSRSSTADQSGRRKKKQIYSQNRKKGNIGTNWYDSQFDFCRLKFLLIHRPVIRICAEPRTSHLFQWNTASFCKTGNKTYWTVNGTILVYGHS